MNTNVGNEGWQKYANCRGLSPNIFYPDKDANELAAKALCSDCVVREDCLEYALANKEDDGIWGGLNRRERRSIIRSRLAEISILDPAVMNPTPTPQTSINAHDGVSILE